MSFRVTPVALGAKYAELKRKIAADPPANDCRWASCLVSAQDVVDAARNGLGTDSPLWLIRVNRGKGDLLARMGWYYTDSASFVRRATLPEAAHDLALFTHRGGHEAELFRVDL